MLLCFLRINKNRGKNTLSYASVLSLIDTDLSSKYTAGNHVTTTDSLHIKIQTNDVIDFDFFANSAKIKVVMAIKCSGSGGESYLEGFLLYLATFNWPIVSNTSQLC